MTFPLGSLRAEGAASGATYTRKSSSKPRRLPPRRLRCWRAGATRRCCSSARWLGCCCCWRWPRTTCATRASPPRAMASRCATRPASSARGCPTWACSCSAIRSGGWCRWGCAPGCRPGACGAPRRRTSRRRVDAAARWPFWIGLVLLMAASCSLEWTRLYQWETRLPGHAGGVLGFTLGPLSSHWLGFAGSGVLWIAALVAGMSLALRFSWLALAERIGASHRRAARTPPAAASSPGRGPAPRRTGAARARAGGRGRAPGARGPPAARHRADAARGAQVRARGQGTAEAAVRRTGRHQAAAGRPARRGAGRASSP